MGVLGAHARAAGALTALFVFALSASTASARPWSGAQAAAVSWQSPTPAEGAQVGTAAQARVTVSLAASGSALMAVRIGSQGLPAGASLDSKPGNPATATFAWTPTAAQAGTHTITFTATSTTAPVVAATPRRIAIVVRAAGSSPPATKPKPKQPKPKVVPDVRTLSGVNNTYRWAKVLRRVVARSAPKRSARVVDVLPFLTPENTQNLVALLESRRIKGKEWVKVRLAKLPNSSVGWVRRGDLGAFRLVRTRLLVNRGAFTATLYRAGKKIFRARIGVGQSQWPTPRGEYYIRMKLCCYSNAVYGPYAFGLSARSAVLTDWPGGGFIGIHGTNAPGLIPGRISHGCIRLRNEDITRLNRLMPVGTPVSVR
jgi:L,D-transpeptidase catalytic domain/Putative Ig domain